MDPDRFFEGIPSFLSEIFEEIPWDFYRNFRRHQDCLAAEGILKDFFVGFYAKIYREISKVFSKELTTDSLRKNLK